MDRDLRERVEIVLAYFHRFTFNSLTFFGKTFFVSEAAIRRAFFTQSITEDLSLLITQREEAKHLLVKIRDENIGPMAHGSTCYRCGAYLHESPHEDGCIVGDVDAHLQAIEEGDWNIFKGGRVTERSLNKTEVKNWK